jgi:hypothetical protein
MMAVDAASSRAVVDLPTSGSVGMIADWVLPLDEWEDGETLRFRARFLGFSSSYQQKHKPHADQYAVPGEKCGACRWFEPRLFREVDGARRYLLYYIGETIVPGEETRYRHQWVMSGERVLDALAIDQTGKGFWVLSLPAQRLVGEAVGHDDELLSAYRDRGFGVQRRSSED